MAKKARKKVTAKAKKPAKRAAKRKAAVAKSRRKTATKAKPVSKKAQPIAKKAKPIAEKKPIVAPQAAQPPRSFVQKVEQKIEGAVAAAVDILTDAERLHHKLEPGISQIPE